MDLLIKNGTIVTATEMYKADIAVDKEKIRIPAVGNIRKLTLVYPVGIGNNPALLCLAENPGQAYHRKPAAINNITQHIACPYGRQLVYITYQHQPHIARQGFQQGVHQDDIYHGALVHNQHITL